MRLARALLALALLGGLWPAPTRAAGLPEPEPRVTATADGLRVEWQAPDARWSLDEAGALSVAVPGFTPQRQPDGSTWPAAAVLIALPAEAVPEIVIESQAEHAVPLPAGAWTPPVAFETVSVTPLGIVRGAPLARLTFYPVRPAGDHLQVTTQVRARVRFGAARLAQPLAAVSDPLLASLQALVVNPADLAPAAPPREAPAQALGAAAPRAAIEVTATGLTAITYEALAASGYPVAQVDPARLQLTRGGVESALEWTGGAQFDPGERLLFFAEPRFSRYTAADVYFLSEAATPGLRMSTRSANPGSLPAGRAWVTTTYEVNQLYTPECYCGHLPAGRDGDRWAWEILRRPDPAAETKTITFTLPSLDTTVPATLTVWLIGYTALLIPNPDHHVTVSANGTAVGAVDWDGQQAVTGTLTIPAGVLHAGDNALGLALPGLPGVTIEGAWLDAFAVRFARGASAVGTTALFTGESAASQYSVALAETNGLRAYDVTAGAQPQRLTGVGVSGGAVTLGDPGADRPRRYALAAEAGLLAPANVRLAASLSGAAGADYLVLAPAAFIPGLADLVALRQGQGLQVVTEDVQAVYDAYDGRPTPDAIRAFLADAYASWTPRPAYVLLVGDGTADPRRYRPDSTETYIPPYLADVDPWAGETAADNRYVTVHGADALPDMLIGRLPVNSPAELQAVVAKLVAYATAPRPGRWNTDVLFISDNSPDQAGDFPLDSQNLAAEHLGPPARASFITVSTPVDATQAAVQAAWAQGAGLMVFNGHSSIHQWAEERAFHLDDVAGLTNTSRLPVVLELTCFTGAFQTPGLPVLDEALVRQPNGGAVAVWGPTGLGVATGHLSLAGGFLDAVYAAGPAGLGEAILAGKLTLAAEQPVAADLLDTFTLLGDPATRLVLTERLGSEVFLPAIRR